MMTRCLICLLLLATLLPAAEKKSKSDTQAEASLVDFDARREGGLILIDGIIRIERLEEPFEGLHLRVELLVDDKVISGLESVVSEALIEEGEEIPFYLQCRDNPRAVLIQVSARGGRKKKDHITLDNPGPYPID